MSSATRVEEEAHDTSQVPRERLFVDDSPTFDAYASAGFRNIGEDTSVADATKLTAPKLSAGAPRRGLPRRASRSRLS